MSIWTGKTYEITKTWGDARWLELPSGKNPFFQLVYYPGGVLDAYHVEFKPGEMQPCWSTAWLLDIGPGQAKARRGNPASGAVPRLEGFMQVEIDGKPRTDHILMEYVAGSSGKRSDDLIVISLRFADGPAPNEEGGGSGPPN